jgi:hypothetical protein
VFGWSFLADVYIKPNMESDAPLNKGSTKDSRSITNWVLTFLVFPPKSTICVITLLRGSFLSWDKRPVILYQVYCCIRIPLISARAIVESRVKFYYKKRIRIPWS